MTRNEALGMIREYGRYAVDLDDVLFGISDRFPSDGSEAKAMRWLGFCQGVLIQRGMFTLEDLKNHSMLKAILPTPPAGCRLIDPERDGPKQEGDGVYDRLYKRWLPSTRPEFDLNDFYCRWLEEQG